MDKRQQYINRFTQGMADIVLSRYMLNHEALLIYNHIERDQYQDPIVVEEGRYKKLVAVKKNNDMSYVQEFVDDLLEDGLNILPWYINMTITDLPRIPRMDDNIIIEGAKYTVARVKPMNRNLDSLITLFIYPTRVDSQDTLWIYDINLYLQQLPTTIGEAFGQTVAADIMYGGSPTKYSWDGVNWYDWELSKVPATIGPEIKFHPPIPDDVLWCNKSVFDGGYSDSTYDEDPLDGGFSPQDHTPVDGGDAFTRYLCFFLTDGTTTVCYTI